MKIFRWLSSLWYWIVAEVQAISGATVRRRVPGAPSSDDAASVATSLAFSVSDVNLGALGAGGTYTATVLDQRGAPISPTTGPAYESSDTSVFTVDPVSGAITAVAEGSAVLIARLGSVRPGLFTVTVKQVPAIVSVPGPSVSLDTGDGANRVAAAVAVDGETDNLTAGTGTNEVASAVAISPTGPVDLDIAA